MYRYREIKPCKFEGCDYRPATGCGGYCYTHREHDPGYARKEAKKSAKKDAKKIRQLVNTSDDKLVQNKGATKFQMLSNFFWEAAKELDKNPRCEECGAFIPYVYYRASTAHVLPKREKYGFPSVAAHPLNRIFLGSKCGCHDRYDDTWVGASKMKVWPKAITIFIELYPFIDPSEYKNIPDILRPYIPNLKIKNDEKIITTDNAND